MELNIDIENAGKLLEGKTAIDILRWCYEQFPAAEIKFSNSFGAEDMVIHHLLAAHFKNPRIFTLDTGRMFQETYDVWAEVVKKYGVEVEPAFPEPEDVAALMKGKGPNLFYDKVENRKNCCGVRKIKPLRKALSNASLWITGLRREQSEARKDVSILGYEAGFKVYKVNPILEWSEQNVWDYIRNNGVPYNKLHDKGYPSIGCAPCTRPVRPAEDWRGGRWWWETDDQKECGLHVQDGKLKPKKDSGNYTI